MTYDFSSSWDGICKKENYILRYCSLSEVVSGVCRFVGNAIYNIWLTRFFRVCITIIMIIEQRLLRGSPVSSRVSAVLRLLFPNLYVFI